MTHSYTRIVSLLAAGFLVPTTAAIAQEPPRVTPMTPDFTEKYEQTLPSADFVRREAMVPMRDGIKLHTTIVMKKGTANGPILLSRTPYDAHNATHRVASQRIVDIVDAMDMEFVADGYIRVYQDIRGLHRSEGAWVLNRPLAGPLRRVPRRRWSEQRVHPGPGPGPHPRVPSGARATRASPATAVSRSGGRRHRTV